MANARLSFVGAAAIVGAVTVAALVVLYLGTLLIAAVPQRIYVAAVDRAIASGELDYGMARPFDPRHGFFLYGVNDCLILNMLLFRAPDAAAAMSPQITAFNTMTLPDLPPMPGGDFGLRQHQQCFNLLSTLRSVHQGRTVPTKYYHRYLHGDWVVAALLLAALPLFAASSLLAATVILLLGALAVAGFARRGGGRRDIAYGAMAAMMLVAYVNPAFDWSFSFAPTDIILAGFLLFAYLRPLSALSEGALVTAAASFGVLTAIFEFLTGGIPAALTVLLCALAFDVWPDRATLLRRAVLAVPAFCAAVLLPFAIKMAVVVAIWGTGEITVSSTQLFLHMGSEFWGTTNTGQFSNPLLKALGVSVDTIKSSRLLTTIYGLGRMIYFSSRLEWGSLVLGVAVTAVIPAILFIDRVWRLRTLATLERARSVTVLAASGVVLVWSCIFTSHLIEHTFMMFRIMAWPFIVLAAAKISDVWRYRAEVASSGINETPKDSVAPIG